MSEIIDFDKLLPEPRIIRLSGKELKVYPGKLKALIKIQKAFTQFTEATGDEKLTIMDELINLLSVIMPGLKDDDVDIAVEQVGDLVALAYQSSKPTNSPLMDRAKMSPTEEKKTDKTSLEP